jgi:hypothetical protein
MTPLRIPERIPRRFSCRSTCDGMPRVHNFGGPLWITGAKTVGGMSGSPGIDKDGRAIGVVCTGSDSENIKDYDGAAHPPHAFLTALDDAAAVTNRTRRALGAL